jgi:exonuclease III
MKLISLNIWTGKAFDPLMEFIKNSAKDTDIFCFQEVLTSPSGISESRGSRANILADIATILPDFVWYFAPEGDGYDEKGPVDFEVSGGQAMFINKKTISDHLIAEGSVFTYRQRKKMARHESFEDLGANFQYARFAINGNPLIVCNVHGMPFPGDKKDTENRLRQSQMIKDFLDKESGAKIICGDLNLMPDTQSIKILETGMVNLIAKYSIGRTRSKLHPYYGKPDEQKFADYMFASPDIIVRNFSVPDVSVSDHLPLILEF